MLILLGTVVLVLGLFEYLTSPTPYIDTIRRDYSKDFSLAEGKSFEVWYDIAKTNVTVKITLAFSLDVADNGTVDFYVMSQKAYFDWKNGSAIHPEFEKKVISHEETSFTPTYDGIYYVVVDNAQYNSTKSVSLRIEYLNTLHMVDYSESPKWFAFALIGFLLLIGGSLLFKSPFTILTENLSDFLFLSRFEKVMGIEVQNYRKIFNIKLLKICLVSLAVVVTSFVLVKLVPDYINLLNTFPEVASTALDIDFRQFLCLYTVIGLSCH